MYGPFDPYENLIMSPILNSINTFSAVLENDAASCVFRFLNVLLVSTMYRTSASTVLCSVVMMHLHL